MKNLLFIDGSYMGHRSMYALGMQSGKEITLTTNEEMLLFEDRVVSDIISIFKSFNSNIVVNNVFFYVDKNSWRHSEKMHLPYYENADKLIGYKENRRATKDKSKVDWDNYHQCLSSACDKIRKMSGFLGLTLNGFEADDLIFLGSFQLSKSYNIFIFANDGDYEQCVINPNVYYFRNNKNQTKGTLIVNKKFVQTKINLAGIDILRQKMANSTGLMDQLSKIDIGKHDPVMLLRNINNGGVKMAEPFFFGFIKAIIGDKKDNILPIIGRFSETGRLTRVLEKNIIASFDNLRDSYQDLEISKNITNNELAKLIVDDVRKSENSSEIKMLTKLFLISLITQLKQKGIAKNVFDHMKLNIKIMMLTQLIFNEKVLNEYKEKVVPLINDCLNQSINLDIIENSLISKSRNDILHNSIPDSEDDDAIVADILGK